MIQLIIGVVRDIVFDVIYESRIRVTYLYDGSVHMKKSLIAKELFVF